MPALEEIGAPSTTTDRCPNCGRLAVFLCTRCRAQKYCSRTCQVQQWHGREGDEDEGHEVTCTLILEKACAALAAAICQGACERTESAAQFQRLITTGVGLSCSYDGLRPLTRAVLAGQHRTVQILINSGAAINAPERSSPLHCAIYAKDLEMIRLLCTNGANVNARDMRDCVPSTVLSSTTIPSSSASWPSTGQTPSPPIGTTSPRSGARRCSDIWL